MQHPLPIFLVITTPPPHPKAGMGFGPRPYQDLAKGSKKAKSHFKNPRDSAQIAPACKWVFPFFDGTFLGGFKMET